MHLFRISHLFNPRSIDSLGKNCLRKVLPFTATLEPQVLASCFLICAASISGKHIIVASKFKPMRQQMLTRGQILVNDSSAIGDERRIASLRLVLEINQFLLGQLGVIRQRHRYHPAMIQDDPVGLGPTHNLIVAFSVEQDQLG